LARGLGEIAKAGPTILPRPRAASQGCAPDAAPASVKGIGTWKLQCLTPNTSVRSVFTSTNTRESGPMVVELPATGDGVLNGTLIEAWQFPLADVGIAGEDQGRGGKYLLLPPDYQGAVPTCYFVVPMKTYYGFLGLRVITKSGG
jgi:hypothetical protein